MTAMMFMLILTMLLSPSVVVALSAGATAPPRVPPRVSLTSLEAGDFRHPLDNDLTNAVRSSPFNRLLEPVIRQSIPLVEQSLRLELLSSALRVSSKQLPDTHASHVEACSIIGLPVTELFVQSSPVANAYTLALQGKTPLVVITSALLDRCSAAEVQAIIGHELGHIKCEHSVYLTLGGLFSSSVRGLPILGARAEGLLEDWRLAAELSCDRAALLVAQDPSVVASALLKLVSGTSRAVSTPAFIAQSKEYESALQSANPIVRASIRMQQRTHPLPVRRVSELLKWADSKQYAAILTTGKPISGSREENEEENEVVPV